jgi:hypothetical protein
LYIHDFFFEILKDLFYEEAEIFEVNFHGGVKIKIQREWKVMGGVNGDGSNINAYLKNKKVSFIV